MNYKIKALTGVMFFIIINLMFALIVNTNKQLAGYIILGLFMITLCMVLYMILLDIFRK
jgi:hypothetical protein